jgi:hypothetical protein
VDVKMGEEEERELFFTEEIPSEEIWGEQLL